MNFPSNPSCVLIFPNEGTEAFCFSAPLEILQTDQLQEVRSLLRDAEKQALDGKWLVGFVSYEAAPAFDAACKVRTGSKLPLLWFAVFEAPLRLPVPTNSKVVHPQAWQTNISPAQFETDIAAIRVAIEQGDVYQINHTLRLNATRSEQLPEDALEWFWQLHAAQPDSYSAYLKLGAQHIYSFSPELFFCRQGQTVITKPMKGTAARGRWLEEDQQQLEWLRHSEKNRAENLMIVDLLRNDLSRIAPVHGVAVTELFAVERHRTLLQMTSTIEAKSNRKLDDIFAALFPCGSITGAPKLKAMEMIARLEAAPRNIYCGAIGMIKPGGDATFNVAIRSILQDHAELTFGVGAGITWGSQASDEFAEVMLKTRFLTEVFPAFELFETLRFENGILIRLSLHLARLAASAIYFNFSFSEAACRTQLEQQLSGASDARVRVRLSKAGQIFIDLQPLPPKLMIRDESIALPVRLAETCLSSNNIYLYHKTTLRHTYDQAWADSVAAHPATEFFDVLLYNERDELTEFTRGNLILLIDGQQLTPKRDCGLLDGCMRRELLEAGSVQEVVLYKNDLQRASHLYFINSLRGKLEVTLPQ